MAVASKAIEINDKWLSRLQSRDGPRQFKPKNIYHYTTADSLISILQNGTMFATDYRFLNDRTEFSHGIERAQKILSFKSSKTDRAFLDAIGGYLNQESSSRSFVCSFSARKDDLSQWRGYANDGEGFTLGFSTDFLCEKSTPLDAPFGFGEVNYLYDTLKKQVLEISNEFWLAFQQTEQSAEFLDEFSSWCEATITNACTFHKHNSFRLEKEWRIVDVVEESDNNRIRVRSKKGRLVPYVEIDLRDTYGKIPITSVGIGPSFTHPFTRGTVEDLCRQYGYEIEVYEAKTPYIRS